MLFRHAVTGAKRVKSQLLLSTANASAAELAIDRMWKEGYDFAGKRCLVIGNGEMGKRSASALREQGAQVTVTVRQYRSGRVEVCCGCSRIDGASWYQCLPQCDVVVKCHQQQRHHPGRRAESLRWAMTCCFWQTLPCPGTSIPKRRSFAM